MARVITFSTKFPSYHSKKGEPTYFVEAFYKSLYVMKTIPKELGKDIIIITPEEAKERGIEIINPTECPLEKQKIKSLLLEKEPPKVIDTLIKSGREETNQRRKSIKRNKGIKPKYQGRKSR